MASLRDDLVTLYRQAVTSLSGEVLVRDALAGRPRPERLHVVALGKAAGAMLHGAEEAWGPLEGLAVGPAGTQVPQGVEFLPGDHPTPGAASFRAGARLLQLAGSLGKADHLLVLLSGGGSSLAELSAPGIEDDELQATTRLLLGAGVPISSFNAVRKHLSALKGGRLGAATGAGQVEVLTLSDVAGNDPATIASGPFAPDPTRYADALQVVRLHGLQDALPTAARTLLEEGAAGRRDETPKAADPRIRQRILAGPLDLPRRAAALATERGYHAIASPRFLAGDVEEVASRWLRQVEKGHQPGTLLAAASEPTVVLPSHPGSGGRSQHLALRIAMGLAGKNAAFLAAGSDGLDGNSANAGAVVDGSTADGGEVDIAGALDHAASAAICARLGVCIPHWETGTNLADLHLLAFGR